MRQKLLVGALVAVSAAYAWGLLWLAWGFWRAGGPIGWGLALATAILLLLTIWVTWRELLFGLASARLDRAYAQQEDPPTGPPEPRAEFERARAAIREAEAAGGAADWRAWFRLGLAYDAMRDRRQARAAVRRAIALERAR
ncbi:hypothetical protein [Brachybacterium hainanense]|uniref:Tetratricopeptide repeat protein n=1 Tax=Brachybacterium hainanense TaxID=1541174 RepID=A0ABV6REV8_9MICO